MSDPTGDELATDEEMAEHDRIQDRLMSGEGTEDDKARYSALHPKVCARRVAESGRERKE